jgi:hypothetical protein
LAGTSLGIARNLGFPPSQWVYRPASLRRGLLTGAARDSSQDALRTFGKAVVCGRVRAESASECRFVANAPAAAEILWRLQSRDGLDRPGWVEPHDIGTYLFQTDTTRYREISYRDNCQQSQQHGRLLPHCCHRAVELVVSVVIRSQRWGIARRMRCLSFPSGVETVC